MKSNRIVSITGLIVSLIFTQASLAQDDILDLLPAIIAGAVSSTPATPAPTVFPPGVTVLPTSTVGRFFGNEAVVYGEVYNNTNAAIDLVSVGVSLFNGAQLVAADTGFVVRTTMPPRTRSCFSVLTNYTGTVTRTRFDAPSFFNADQRTPNLALSNVTRSETVSGNIDIVGTIKNNEAVNVNFSEVIATMYNAANRVVDCDFAFANSGNNSLLAPGQSASFDFISFTPNGLVSRFVLQTDGDLPR